MNRTKPQLYLTGNLPPPIGGVTKFIEYFLDASNKSFYSEFSVLLQTKKLLSFWKFKESTLLINSSNALKRLIFVFLGRLFFREVYFVKHGAAIKGFSPFFHLSVYLSNGVFCLNSQVYNSLNFEKKKMLITTIFKENCSGAIGADKKDIDLLFYSNNKKKIDGNDIYGIDFLCEVMKTYLIDAQITIVDLSGSYEQFFKMFSNVTYISSPVNFIQLLSRTKVYVRPTVTDGMSVAILEALSLGVNCVASDAAERPEGVITYKNLDVEDFVKKVNNSLEMNSSEHFFNEELTSIYDMIDFIQREK